MWYLGRSRFITRSYLQMVSAEQKEYAEVSVYQRIAENNHKDNSAVVHGGFANLAGSLKAKCCVEVSHL